MFDQHALADEAGAILFEKVERRLEALLAEHGASVPGELPPALQGQLLQDALVDTAAASFPTTDIDMLKHGLQSFTMQPFLRQWSG
jgi:hypothetical protein